MKKLIFLLFILYSFSFSALIHPENGANERTIHILFEWNQIPNSEYYNLQVSTQSSFSIGEGDNIIIDKDVESTVSVQTEGFTWENNYYWRVRGVDANGSASNWSDISSFSIDSQRLINLDLNAYDDELVFDGVLVYSQFLPYFIVGAIDKDGNEIWNTDLAYMNHINEFGQMYGIVGNDSYSRGCKYNFHHNFLWESPTNYDIDSHEVKQIPNGNYMTFQRVFQTGPVIPGDWSFYFQGQGYQADGITNEFPWLGLKVVEFDKDTNQEVWSWDPFEHFSMDDHDLYEGTWWNAAFDGFYDWMHSNAFHFDDEESVIYLSHRHLSRITKIDYPSGNVIWNMGLPDEYNTGENNICTNLLFSYQHHIQLLENGDLLFFDNGNLSDMLLGDTNPTTRIRRVRVINDSYCETLWQYDLPQNLYALGMGSVQELDNGNYSIYTYGSGLNDSECSILEINPAGDVLWKATSQNYNTAWYRSYKIPSIYPDAFSVVADDFIDGSGIFNQEIIISNDNQIKFRVFNESGFKQVYDYEFNGPFEESGQLILFPSESQVLSFDMSNQDLELATVNLSIWPTYHKYALKDLIFDVLIHNGLLGDINLDNQINIIDIVELVNIVLSGDYVDNADINHDQFINVLDIITLVNIILNI